MNKKMDMCTKPFNGVLFIGDPHVSSMRIGRRKDDYLASVLDKLAQSAEISTRLNLYPVILGDLFHSHSDSKMKMLVRLTRIFQSFPVPPLVLDGNHGKVQTKLSDDDALTLLSITGVLDLWEHPGEERLIQVGGAPVRLIGFPHESKIPEEVSPFAGTTLAVTHHDLGFGSNYPGCIPLFEIKGVDAVVNGHIHNTKPSVKVGKTWWHNPGNIEPLSVDLMNHIPAVWSWQEGQSLDTLQRHVLAHETDVFDLTGLEVAAAEGDEAVAEVAPLASEFAQMLSSNNPLDAIKTDDASILLWDLQDVLEVSTVSEAAKNLIRALAAEMIIET